MRRTLKCLTFHYLWSVVGLGYGGSRYADRRHTFTVAAHLAGLIHVAGWVRSAASLTRTTGWANIQNVSGLIATKCTPRIVNFALWIVVWTFVFFEIRQLCPFFVQGFAFLFGKLDGFVVHLFHSNNSVKHIVFPYLNRTVCASVKLDHHDIIAVRLN